MRTYREKRVDVHAVKYQSLSDNKNLAEILACILNMKVGNEIHQKTHIEILKAKDGVLTIKANVEGIDNPMIIILRPPCYVFLDEYGVGQVLPEKAFESRYEVTKLKLP